MAPRPPGVTARSTPAALLGILLLAGIPASSPAQTAPEPSESTPAPTEAPAPPTPALPEVAAGIDESEGRLRALRPLATPDPEVTAIEERLDARVNAIEEGLARTEELLEGDVGLDELRDFEQAWLGAQDEIAEARRTVTRRATQLDERVAELQQMRTRWEEVLDRARQEGAPPTLLDRVQGLLGDIATTTRSLGERRGAVLALQSRLAEQEERIAEVLDRVRQEMDLRRSQLLRPDHPPLWRILPPGPADLAPPRGLDLRDQLDRSLAYFGRRLDDLSSQGLLLVGAFALLLHLRRRAGHWSPDDPRRSSAVLWQRPVATVLFLAILTWPLFHPHGPRLLRELAGLFMLVPLLRLLPALLPKSLHPALIALAAFYVVDRLREFMTQAPVAERLVFLGEIAVAAGLLAALLRPARLARLPRDAAIPPVVAPLLRLALALLGVSLLANVFGFLELARLLGEGVLTSAYGVTLLYGGLQVVVALVRIAFRSHLAARLHMVRRHRALLQRRVEWGLRVLAVFLGAGFVLEVFTLRQPVADGLRTLFGASITFGTVTLALGDVAAFALTATVAVWLARALTFLLEEDVFPRVPLQRGIPSAISATARYAILFGGFLLAVAAAGVDFERFTILAGALGVGIGFGLQNIVNNFVSGLILLYERPIQVGDAIQMTDLFGEVRRIGIRSSTVRTWDGAEVIVPNADLISSRVTNWTLSDRTRRMTVRVGVAYGSDPERVLEILRRVAREHPEVLDEPAPFARFVGFGESSLDFELWAFTGRFEKFWPTVNDVILSIHAALGEAGITIPFPQRDLHLRSVPGPGAPPRETDPPPGPPGRKETP